MSPPPERSLAAGHRVAKYEIVRRLAIGGMGEIFLAREQGVAAMGRLVVVKQLIPELAEDPTQIALFIDEARIATQLVHPNIVQIYDFGSDDGVHYMAMEHVPGPNLARICARALQRGQVIARDVGVYVIAEMARALDYAHKAEDSRGRPLGIVHRDVSPHNVLVSHHGDVKLMDFGIARANIRRQRTQTGTLRGKLAYMSPEQAAQKPLDIRSDVFSAGVVLWETTLMQRLFASDNQLETIRRVTECDVPAPRSLDSSYPEELEAIVMTALAADPDQRFQSAAALHSALRTVLSRHAPVEAEQLGTIVRELFPEVVRPALSEAPRMTKPVARAAVPLFAPPDRAVADVPAPARRLPGAAIAAGLVAVVMLAAVLFIWQSGGSSSGPAIVAADAAPVLVSSGVGADGSVAAAGPAGEREVSAAADAAVAPASEGYKRRPRRPRPTGSPALDAGIVSAAKSAPDAGPSSPPVSPAVERGEIAVASQPYGRVTIDGRDYGYTDLQRRLAVGDHVIRVKLSDGSGTFTASARIEAGKKTKCIVADKSLVCRSQR